MNVVAIVGMGRSGSTLLDLLLGSIDGVFSAGELRFLWERGLREGRLCGCGEPMLRCPIWSHVLKSSELVDLDVDEVVGWQRRNARLRHTRRLARETTPPPDAEAARLVRTTSALYGAIAGVTGATFIVDSSKRATDALIASRAPSVENTFVVHIVRDPRAVAHSWPRGKADPGDPSTGQMPQQSSFASAIRWLALNSSAAKLEQRLGRHRYLRIHYEDLARSPVESLRRVAEFVGMGADQLPFTGDRMRLEVNHTVGGNPVRFTDASIRVRPDDAWKTAMPWWSRVLTTGLTLPALRRFGYPIRPGSSPRPSHGPAGR